MSPRFHRSLPLSLSCLLLLGCPQKGQLPTATVVRRTANPVTEVPDGASEATPARKENGGEASGVKEPVIVPDPNATIRGRVLIPAQVVSNNGGALIGNNGASLIGNNGGSLIGNNGASIVSNNGGSLIGNNGASFRFAQYRVSNAKVQVFTADGRAVKDATGAEIVSNTNAQGEYTLPTSALPANAVIRVTSPAFDGELSTFVSREQVAKGAEIDVDIISSLAIQFILDRYVKGNQETFERLTAPDELAARQALATSIDDESLKPIVALNTQALVAAVSASINEEAAVETAFLQIERSLIYFGFKGDGEGMSVYEYPFGRVHGVARVGDMTVMYSRTTHSLSGFGADGILHPLVRRGEWGYPDVIRNEGIIPLHSGMLARQNTLFIADTHANRVVKLEDGKITTVVGNGTAGPAKTGALATETPLDTPTGLAILPDGALVFSEAGTRRILKLDLQGRISLVAGGGERVMQPNEAVPAASVRLTDPQGIALVDKTKLYVCEPAADRVVEIDLESGVAKVLETGSGLKAPIGVSAVASDVFVNSFSMPGLYRLREGASELMNSANFSGATEMLERSQFPTYLASDGGMLFFSDENLVYKADVDGRAVSLIAGRRIVSNANAEYLTGAFRFSISKDGILAVADAGQRRIFTIDAQSRFTHVAGTGNQGFVASSQSPAAMDMGSPTDLEWTDSGDLLFSVGGPYSCLKRLSSDGSVITLAGNGKLRQSGPLSGKAEEVPFSSIREFVRMKDGRTLLVESFDDEMSVLDATGQVAPFVELAPLRQPKCVSQAPDGSFVFAQMADREILRVNGASRGVVATATEVEKYFPFPSLKAVQMTSDGWLYVAGGPDESDGYLLRKKLGEAEFQVVAGKGGLALGGTGGDNGLLGVKDFLFDPTGDLFLLELGTVKRVPHERLQ